MAERGQQLAGRRPPWTGPFVDLLQQRLGMDMLGGGQPYAGKFAAQYQRHGAGFVAVQRTGALSLLVAARGGSGGGGALFGNHHLRLGAR